MTDALNTEYDRIRLLKDGERGSISLVRHRSSGKRFVLRSFQGSAEVYQKLLGFRSPHLPEIMEVAEKDGQVLVLEEYILGDSLAFLLQEGTLSVKESRDIARQICHGLWALHSIGAVHRDVKPSNIILRGSEAVLIDFDASRIHKPQNSSDTVVLGTTGFAAPEQYGLSQTDPRSDIYSLGVTMNVMLTGQHPSRELAAGAMGRIIERCTMVNPKKRYKDIVRLMAAL